MSAEQAVTRLLVVAEVSAVSEVLREELYVRGRYQSLEVFILFPSFARNLFGQLRPTGRFWSRADTCLDALLQELSARGILADGIVSEASPVDGTAELLRTFVPGELLVVARRRGPRYRARFERALWSRAGDASPQVIGWLPP
jgi:hypothetical protein